jgi:hypothetical protein
MRGRNNVTYALQSQQQLQASRTRLNETRIGFLLASLIYLWWWHFVYFHVSVCFYLIFDLLVGVVCFSLSSLLLFSSSLLSSPALSKASFYFDSSPGL